MKIVVLTDTHFVAAGETLYALCPARRLEAALAVIARDHPDIAFVLISGDLAHWGQPAAYRELRRVLSAARVPVRLMVGNHDRRAAFREVFPEAAADPAGFIQFLEVREAFTLIALDTLDESTHAGLLCRPRLDFLSRALAEAPTDRPVLLAQHHPPFDVGLPHMDRIRLRNGDEEAQLLAGVRKPDYLLMGHIHRPVAGRWQGIPFHIQRAVAHGVAFDLETRERVPGSHEQPDYALLSVSGGDITILHRSFLYEGPEFWLDDEAAQRATASTLPRR